MSFRVIELVFELNKVRRVRGRQPNILKSDKLLDEKPSVAFTLINELIRCVAYCSTKTRALEQVNKVNRPAGWKWKTTLGQKQVTGRRRKAFAFGRRAKMTVKPDFYFSLSFFPLLSILNNWKAEIIRHFTVSLPTSSMIIITQFEHCLTLKSHFCWASFVASRQTHLIRFRSLSLSLSNSFFFSLFWFTTLSIRPSSSTGQ